MIRRSSLINSQTKVGQKLMAHEVLLEPRLLLLLSGPISLEYGDRIFVDSRRVFRLSHARVGKVVCARRSGKLGDHGCKSIYAYHEPLISLSQRVVVVAHTSTAPLDGGRGVPARWAWWSFWLTLLTIWDLGGPINRENLSFAFPAYIPLIQASVCRHLFC
jgi:hypothetical protein